MKDFAQEIIEVGTWLRMTRSHSVLPSVHSGLALRHFFESTRTGRGKSQSDSPSHWRTLRMWLTSEFGFLVLPNFTSGVFEPPKPYTLLQPVLTWISAILVDKDSHNTGEGQGTAELLLVFGFAFILALKALHPPLCHPSSLNSKVTLSERCPQSTIHHPSPANLSISFNNLLYHCSPQTEYW